MTSPPANLIGGDVILRLRFMLAGAGGLALWRHSQERSP
jgi:hypothetical protein